jgi:hypothetical protein
MQTIPPSGGVRPIIFGRSSVVVHFAQKTDPPLVIPKPALSARNPFAASGETADSSRDNAALRNDKSLGIPPVD